MELMPGIAQLIGKLDDQDAVLGCQSDQHDQANLAVQIERVTTQVQPRSAPAIASGTVSMITNGCIQLSNCAASTR